MGERALVRQMGKAGEKRTLDYLKKSTCISFKELPPLTSLVEIEAEARLDLSDRVFQSRMKRISREHVKHVETN